MTKITAPTVIAETGASLWEKANAILFFVEEHNPAGAAQLTSLWSDIYSSSMCGLCLGNGSDATYEQEEHLCELMDELLSAANEKDIMPDGLQLEFHETDGSVGVWEIQDEENGIVEPDDCEWRKEDEENGIVGPKPGDDEWFGWLQFNEQEEGIKE